MQDMLLSFLSLALFKTPSLSLTILVMSVLLSPTLILAQSRVVLEGMMGEELEEVLFISTDVNEWHSRGQVFHLAIHTNHDGNMKNGPHCYLHSLTTYAITMGFYMKPTYILWNNKVTFNMQDLFLCYTVVLHMLISRLFFFYFRAANILGSLSH